MGKIAVCKALLVLTLAFGLSGANAWAQAVSGESVVYAIGSSRISGGDLQKAREDAIQAGLIMAVSRALTDAIAIDSLVSQFKAVNETILSRMNQFVRGYRVLTESDTGGTYRLLIQATVSIDELKAAVAPWLKQDAGGGIVEIRVTGVSGRIAEFVRFRGALSGINGVSQLQMKELSSDTGVLTATYQGSASVLAEAAQQLTFETFQVQVVDVAANSIEMRLVMR
jgi:hypothetical protein